MVVANPFIPSLSIHSSWIHLLEKGIGYCYSLGCYRNTILPGKKNGKVLEGRGGVDPSPNSSMDFPCLSSSYRRSLGGKEGG